MFSWAFLSPPLSSSRPLIRSVPPPFLPSVPPYARPLFPSDTWSETRILRAIQHGQECLISQIVVGEFQFPCRYQRSLLPYNAPPPPMIPPWPPFWKRWGSAQVPSTWWKSSESRGSFFGSLRSPPSKVSTATAGWSNSRWFLNSLNFRGSILGSSVHFTTVRNV